MQNRYKKIIFSLVTVFFVLFPQVSLTQGIKNAFGSGSPLADVKTRTGYSDEDLGSMSGRIINTALTTVGIIFLLLMVYAGYLWMTARGEEAQITKALGIVKGTIIGLVLVLSAYAITVFVTKGLNPSSNAGGGCSLAPSSQTVPGCTSSACVAISDQATCTTGPCCIWTAIP